MKDCRRIIHEQLNSIYSEREIESMFRIVIEALTGWDYSQFIINRNETISEELRIKFIDWVNRLEKSEPLQYIIGETEFFDLKFKVNKNVLIPRQETEELVDLIIRENSNKDLQLLDVGTGSGCIAISLAKNLPKAKVHAFDVSEGALGVATENAKLNNVNVEFQLQDILKWREENFSQFDVIVSNPPYIRISEKEQMRDNVLDFEPHLALFVEEDDPLLFYREIALFAAKYLNLNGKIYFEINEVFGLETKLLLEEIGFKNCQIINDLNGKARIVTGVLM
ncbi:peptide chain release factor N(5)-glutamine methyltransferase [Prolixibacteraceae bacterium JC049]|nr:peptide chain release factor N(5)-glutamine methyltransferase [Prolixibacteraceae bacterium JC049]